MSIESFAAIVGDSDGAAFVTKAEFEGLKAEFDRQLDDYNNSLAEKIDGVIASYLNGLKVEMRRKTSTGFDLVGQKRKEIRFLGQTNNSWNFENVPYAQDKIVLYANGAFSSGNSHYIHDTYDNWLWDGTTDTGNTTNTYFLIDKNRCVEHIYWNVAMYSNRFYAFYSTTNAQDGITWNDITIQLDHPTALVITDNACVNSTNSIAHGYGHSRISFNGTPNATYPNKLDAYMFSSGNVNSDTSATPRTKDQSYYIDSEPTGTSDGAMPRIVVVTPLEEKTQANLHKQLSVAMSKNEEDYGIHACYLPTTTIHTSDQEWNTIGMVEKKSSDLISYTVTARLRFASGYWANAVRDLSEDKREINGYGVKFHEILDTTKADKPPKWTFNDVYYKELNKVWDETTKIKYTGGFPVYKAETDGTLEFRIKSDKATNIIFTTSQNASMPTNTQGNVRPFDYKRATVTSYTRNVKNFNITANTDYDFKIELYKGEIIYLNINSASGNVKVNQIGDAYWTSV